MFSPSDTSFTPVTHTALPPRIVAARKQRRWRKACGIIGACLLVISPLVAANINSCHSSQTDSVMALHEVKADTLAPSVRVPLERIGNAMPSSFRAAKPNVLIGADCLARCRAILLKGERPLRVLHIGDSHVAGRTFPVALKRELQRLFGAAATDTTGCGIAFHYYGKNGATTEHFLTDAYAQQFSACRPDLIIISLGTNEAHGMGYLEAPHTRQLETFLQHLEKACPEAEYVLTTPPGDYLATRYVDYRRTARSSKQRRVVHTASRPNPMTRRCADNIVQFAAAHHLAAYDLFHVCGGEEAAVRNWLAAHYMRPDRIHFTPQGYEVMGTLVAQAVAKALAEKQN